MYRRNPDSTSGDLMKLCHRVAKFPVSASLILAIGTLLAFDAAAGSVEILATGLANPRGIAIGPAGRILVVEAGSGGSPVAMTGHVTEVFRGKVRRLLALPSATVLNGEVSGPTSIALAGGLGEMFVTMGGGPGVPFGFLLRSNPARSIHVADITGHEIATNPDGVQPPDSNPYGVAIADDGGILVADAAANDLLYVDAHGVVSTVAVFPTAPNVLFPIGGPTVQAVPTSVAVGPDGAWYVAELRGFPFTNPSHVWRIEPGSRGVHCVVSATSGPCTDWANGLRHVVSIAFGPDGSLYASQFGPGPGPAFLPGWATTGSIVRIDATTKAISVVYSGLTAPGGIVVDGNGVIYVTNRSTSPDSGEILRIEP
jgi:sugar lactone lactonase YvrE